MKREYCVPLGIISMFASFALLGVPLRVLASGLLLIGGVIAIANGVLP